MCSRIIIRCCSRCGLSEESILAYWEHSNGSNPFQCWQVWRKAGAIGPKMVYGTDANTVPDCLISQMGLDADPYNYYTSQHTAERRAAAQQRSAAQRKS